MRPKSLLLAVLLAAAIPPCFSQDAQPPIKYSAKVQLIVRAADSIENQLNSFLRCELRSLGDVTVVDGKDGKPDFVISIVAIELGPKGGPVTGFAIAKLITKPERADFLTEPPLSLKGRIEDPLLNLLSVSVSAAERVLDFGLQTDSKDGMQRICQDIIADFDAQMLDWRRALWRDSQRPPVENPK